MFLLPGLGCAQPIDRQDGLSEIVLPGGVRAALAVLKDPLPPDRSQFLVEIIRRTYATPIAVRTDSREVALRALLAHLERSQRAVATEAAETIPLPLTPAIWIDVVFGGRATPDTLVSAILESRSASLLYYGLLSLDGPTREWLASQPALLADIASRYAPAFAVAAPGMRVARGRVRVPGGAAAESAWEALVGRRVTEPAEFIRALVARDEGRTAYFLTAMAEPTGEQIAFALGRDAGNQPAVLRRLSAVFDRVSPGWKVADRTIWRPRRDPALLLGDLTVDDHGRPLLPGSRAFWSDVFSGVDASTIGARAADLAGDASDFAWLCDQVFIGTPSEQRHRYEAVLFASRVLKGVGADVAADALETVHAAIVYPALTAVLERAGIVDVATYAIAARRAARLSAIGDGNRRARAVSQYQGTLALLARMASRGSIERDAFRRAVVSLSGVELSEQGDYAGSLVEWFGGWVESMRVRPDAIEDDQLLQLLAGPPAVSSRYVDWEGTWYRLDFTAAESTRLARLLGEDPHPYLSSARTLVGIAGSLASAGAAKDRLREDAGRLNDVAAAIGLDSSEWRAFSNAAGQGDVATARRLAPRLRAIADDVWARGAVELAYAVALGQPEHAAFSVTDISRRHDLGIRGDFVHATGPWFIPVTDVSAHGYRVSGSLLGLEMALGEFSLTRVSARAPARKPSISSEERAVFVATVPLIEPALLSDDGHERILSAIRAARTQVGSIRTSAEAVNLAESIPLGSIRRTLLPWVVVHDPSRTSSFLSPVELLWIGLGTRPVDSSLQAWGVSAHTRLGCLCLQVIDRRPEDVLAGRVNAGMLASGFPDLGLRVAELLADLHMPGALIGGVLASATSDFVNGATSRDEDDRRGLVEFVLALRVDRIEEYLAMLTTGGPLVPSREDSDRLEGVPPAETRR